MRLKKMPNSKMGFPRFRRLKRIFYFTAVNLGIAFLMGHYLMVFRQPVTALIVLCYGRYWWTQAVLVPSLLLLLLLIALLTRTLWQRRHKMSRWRHVVLQVGIGVISAIYLLERLIHLWFHTNKISIEDSGYMDSEFEVLKMFIVLYNVGLLAWYQYREKESKQRRLDHAIGIIELKREKRRQMEFGDLLERSFIILLEKNNVCEVCYHGKVETLDIAEGKLDELLDYAYVQINRWTFVRLDAVLWMDADKELTYLKKEEERIFNTIPSDTGFLKTFKEKIKHTHGLMTLTKTYVSAAIKKWEEYRARA